MPQRNLPHRLLAESYPCRIEARLLFSDMDAFRHINNGAIGRYLEEGRAALNMELFGQDVLVAPREGLQLLFADVAIEYLAQVRYPGSIVISTGVSRVGNSSWTLAQAAFQKDRCVALATSVVVKAAQGRPVPLDPAQRAALAAVALVEPASVAQ